MKGNGSREQERLLKTALRQEQNESLAGGCLTLAKAERGTEQAMRSVKELPPLLPMKTQRAVVKESLEEETLQRLVPKLEENLDQEASQQGRGA